MFSLEQSVKGPTHDKGHTLDLVLYRPTDGILSKTTVDQNLKSDHLAVVCKLNIPKPQIDPVTFSFRPIREIDPSSFKSDVSVSMSPNCSLAEYNDTLRTILDRHAPLRTHTSKRKKSTPWFNTIADQFYPLRRQRRRAERAWRKSGFLTVFKQIYEAIKRKLTDLVDNAKIAYFSSKIQGSKTCKELYNNFNKLTGKTNESPLPSNYDASDLPSVFSDYFANKISKIRSNFPPYNPQPDISTFHGTTCESFTPVTQDFVLSILKSMAPKSCELDPIPTCLLYEHLDVLLPTITNLINDSLSSGTIPAELKTAVVKPLLKKPSLDSDDLKNYRPISNLPFLSKVLEKVVLQQLLQHLQENNLCNSFQSAYRANHSTETALLRVVNDLLQAMDRDKISLLLLLDLSAAFDTVDHQILIDRLRDHFGIRSAALSWFQSYLSNRKQFVSVGDHKSMPTELCFGVPQGSVLGPVLFVLYTTPLSDLIKDHSIHHQLFADDTQLHKSSSPNSLPVISDELKDCTSAIKVWMSENQLKLNDDKTEAILLAPDKFTDTLELPSSVPIGSHSIPFSDSARNLGFVLDSKLTMKKHVVSICQSAYCELRRISSIRRYLTKEATQVLVTSCILSKLDYCNSLLMGTDLVVTNPMQKVQNFAARLIFGASRRQSADPLIQSLHWLKIRERIDYKVCSICFKILTKNAPSYLIELLPMYNNLAKLRSASDTRKLQEIRYTRKTHGYRSFQHYGPFVWNKLPYHVRHSEDMAFDILRTWPLSNLT
jgi:hypothetical protein